jgi:hypothetical protein
VRLPSPALLAAAAPGASNDPDRVAETNEMNNEFSLPR